jgi:hypothetical protein
MRDILRDFPSFDPYIESFAAKKAAPVKHFHFPAFLLALLGTTALVPSAAASAPTVSITAQYSTISAGQSDVLTVKTGSAASCHVTGSDGSSYTLPYSGGTITVKPTATTTYTASATNGGGTTTAKVTVTVGAAKPTVSIRAQNSTITSGSSDTLTVSASNATKVMVTGSDGSSYTLATTGGTVSVKPTSTTTYTAEASNSGHGDFVIDSHQSRDLHAAGKSQLR